MISQKTSKCTYKIVKFPSNRLLRPAAREVDSKIKVSKCKHESTRAILFASYLSQI